MVCTVHHQANLHRQKHVTIVPEASNFDYIVISCESREKMWRGPPQTQANKRLNYFEIKLFLLK